MEWRNDTLEQWYFQYTTNGYFKIRSRWSNKVIGVNGASLNNGAVTLQWDDTGTLDQQWRFIPARVTNYDFVAPAAPTLVTANANAVSVQLNWKTNSESDLASYSVLRATNSGGPYEICARGLTNNSFTDKWANQRKRYYYVVKAVDRSLNSSVNSTQVSARPAVPAMVAQYTFEGNSNDSSGNANNPILTSGTPTFVAGKLVVHRPRWHNELFRAARQSVAGVTNFTCAAWVYWNGGDAWQRILISETTRRNTCFCRPVRQRHVALPPSPQTEVALNKSRKPRRSPPAHGSTSRSRATATRETLHQRRARRHDHGTTISPANFNPVLNYLGKSQ